MKTTCRFCGKPKHATAAEREVLHERDREKLGYPPGPILKNPKPSYSPDTPICRRVTNALFKALRTVPMDEETIKAELEKAGGTK